MAEVAAVAEQSSASARAGLGLDAADERLDAGDRRLRPGAGPHRRAARAARRAVQPGVARRRCGSRACRARDPHRPRRDVVPRRPPLARRAAVGVRLLHAARCVAVDLDGGAEPRPSPRCPSSRRAWAGCRTARCSPSRCATAGCCASATAAGPSVHADLADLAPGTCNDMVVDSQGRAYVGNFGFDLHGGRADPRGGHRPRRRGRHGRPSPPRTSCSRTAPSSRPTARTLIVAETLGGRLTAFDLGDDGTLSNRRVWATLSPVVDTEDMGELLGGGRHRGRTAAALDAEGCVWGGRRARRPRAARAPGRRDRARRSRRAPASSPARSAGPRGGRSSCAPPPVRRARAPRHARGRAPRVRGRRAAGRAALGAQGAQGRPPFQACQLSTSIQPLTRARSRWEYASPM